jgi:hypothetical protein
MNALFIVMQLFIVLFAITIHEASHGWAANKMGDPTAHSLGRVSLNPIAHIDPIGTILLPVLLSLTGGPAFGWAKPVPVNPYNLRNPRRDNIWISFAGPASNLLAAFSAFLVLFILKKEDLPILLDHFADKYCRDLNKERVRFTPNALDLLMNYSWSGNVRELQNEVQRSLILCGEDRFLREDHLSPSINPLRQTSNGTDHSFSEAKAEFVRRFLNQALQRCNFNKARTAEEIGLSRQGLFKLLKKHGIEEEQKSLSKEP